MDENRPNTPQEEEVPKFRGLYRYVKIPVKVLDAIIIACILVIIVVVVLELRNPGFTVNYDAKGGTDVAAQSQDYGELEGFPEPPTREGYTFTGWYKDPGCTLPWNLETDTVEGDMTLYAGWQKNE